MQNLRKNYWWIILLIFLFHLINNYIILSLDKTLPAYDELGHFLQAFHSLNFFRDLKEGFSLKRIMDWYHNLGGRTRPPLYALTLLFPLAVFQKNIINNIDLLILIVNSFYLMILLISIYGIGRKIGDELIGILSAFIVSVFPGIFSMSRVIMVDFPLTAIVSLSVYSMLLTENFTRRNQSFLLGIFLGLGMLTKATYPIFILPLLGYYFVFAIIKTSQGDKKIFKIMINFIISLLVAFFLSSSWYLPNLDKITQRSKAMSFQLYTGSSKNFISYLTSLIFWGILDIKPFFIAVLYLLGLISLFYFKKEKGIPLVIWTIIPSLFFSFSPNQQLRFLLPILPSIGLTIALITSLLKWQTIKKTFICFIVIFSLYFFFVVSYGRIKLMSKDKDFFYSHNRVHKGIVYPLQSIDWKIKDIGEIIFSNIKRKPREILFVFNMEEIRNGVFLYLLNKNINATFDCPAQNDFFDSPSIDEYEDLSKFDFIITKDGYQGTNAGNINWIEILTERMQKYKDYFFLVGSVKGLPDSSTVYVYKNILY